MGESILSACVTCFDKLVEFVAQKGFRFIFRNTHRSRVCLVLHQMLASWRHGVRSWGRWGFCLEEFSFLFEGAGVAWKRLARSDAPLSRRVFLWFSLGSSTPVRASRESDDGPTTRENPGPRMSTWPRACRTDHRSRSPG